MSTKNFFVKDGLKVKGNTLLNGANYNDTALAKLHVKSAANGVSANLNNVNGLIVENSGSSDSNYIFKLATGSGNIFNITNSGKVGVGTTSPVENLTVVGNISASGSIYGNVEDVTMELENLEVENFTVTGATCLNTLSVSGDSTLASVTATELVLSGDVEADEFVGNLRGAVSFTAKASGALTKGDAVYIAGISGNTTVVDKADADDASKMPAFGIASETVNANANVTIINFGAVTNLDTSSYTEGTELYISTTAGQLTNTAPTGEGSLVQKIAKVTRQDNAAGSITVMGAGRTNAVPNLNQGSIFVGNSSNQAVADNSVYVKIGSNPRIGIGTTIPATDLHIYSETAASRSIRVTSCDGAGSLYFGDCTDPSKAGFTVGQYARTMTLVAGCCSLVTLNNTNDCKWVGVGTASPNAPLHVYTDSAVSETVAKFEKGLGDSTLTISSTCLGIKLKSTGCSTINVDSTCLAIGTNSPTALLDVRGTTNISGTVGIGTTSACAAAKLHVNRDDTIRTDVILENNDNTANAELASIQYRGLDNGNASQLYAQIVGLVDDPTAGSEQGRLSFETVTSGSVSPRMTIDGSNVGIGTNSPNEKLTVVGNISATGSIYGNIEDVSLNLTLSEGTLFVGNSANTATEDSTIFVDTANSRVGIGTTSPATALNVSGSALANTLYAGSSTSAAIVIDSSTIYRPNSFFQIIGGGGQSTRNNIKFTNGAGLVIDGGSGETCGVEIKGGGGDVKFTQGNVGIGTTSPDTITHLYSTAGDTVLTIEADGDNNNEDDNPQIHFLTDSGMRTGAISVGNATLSAESGCNFNAFNIIGTSGGIKFYTGSAQDFCCASVRAVIDCAGNFGIGTTSPSYNFNVEGISYLNPTSANSTLILGRYSGQRSIQAHSGNSGYLIMDSNGGANAGVAALNWYSSDNVILGYGGGNVGIGTNLTGTCRLYVNGDTHIEPNCAYALRLGRIGGAPNIKAAGDGWMIMDSTGAAVSLNHYTNNNVYIANGGGNVGIGSASASYKLDIVTPTGDGIRLNHSDVWARMVLATKVSQTCAESLSGHASIFTTTPSSTGDWPFNTTNGEYGALVLQSRLNSNGGIVLRTGYSSSYENTLVLRETGNVGIGTTSPTEKLEVAGNIIAKDSGFLAGTNGDKDGFVFSDLFTGGGNYWGYKGFTGSSRLSIVTDGAERLTVISDGKVGIGTIAPNEKLTVSGNISASGTVYADAFNSTTGGSAISFNDDVTLAGSLTATNICATSNITNCGNIVSCGNVIQTAGCVIACTCVQTPQVLGTKISVGSLNAGYDFYNNGTSYLNGATTIDDTVTISCHICMAGGSGSRLYFNGLRWAEGSTSGGGQLTLAEDYTLAQFRSSLCVCNDLTVAGNFTVHGTTTTLNTTVTATSAMCICNAGTGPALELNQTGTQPVVDLQDDGTSVFYIEDGGNVGIGTTDPNQKLHITGSTLITNNNYHYGYTSGGSQATLVGITSSNNLILSQNNANIANTYIYGGTGNINLTPAGDVYVNSASLYVDDDVQIGATSTPDLILKSSGTGVDTNGKIYWKDCNGTVRASAGYETGSTEFIVDNTYSGGLYLKSNGTVGLTLNSAANVGIGTASPVSKLDVYGDGEEIYLRSNDHNLVRIIPRGTGANLDKGLISIFDTGTEDIRFDAGGNSWIAGGQFGVGTSSVSYPFEVKTNTTGLASRIWNQNTNGEGVLIRSGDVSCKTRVFQVASQDDTKIFTINSDNTVGIGVTNPTNRLVVVNTNTDSTPTALLQNSSTGDASLHFNISGRSYTIGIDNSDGDKFKISRNNGLGTTDRLTINGDGNVGIGTTDPTISLEVKDSQDSSFDSGIGIIRSANSQTGYINMVGGAFNFNAPSAIPIKFRDGGTVNMTILGDGNVGVGNSHTPQYALDVKKPTNNNDDTIINIRANWANVTDDKKIGSVAFTAYDIDVNSGTDYIAAKVGARASNQWTAVSNVNADLVFETINSGTLEEQVRIDHTGNVGIGTTSPNEKLTVSGNISASGVIYGDTFCSNSGSSSTIDFNDNLDIDGYITASDYIETTNTSTTSAMVMGFKDQFKRTYTTEYSFTQSGSGLHTFNLAFPTPWGSGLKYKAVLIIQRQGSAYTFGSIEDNSYIYRESDNDFTHRSEDQVLVSSGLGSSNSVVLSGDITSFNTDYVTSSTLSGTSPYDYYVVRYPLDFNYNFSGTNKIMVHLETYNYSGPDPVFTIA